MSLNKNWLDLTWLQYVQNTAAPIVTLTRKYDSITPIMFKLHWLPVHVQSRITYCICIFKLLHCFSLLSHRRFSRSLPSSGQELLTVPLAKLKTYGYQESSTAASMLWNNLPFSICKSPLIAIFKKHLKTYLFKEAYDFYLLFLVDVFTF